MHPHRLQMAGTMTAPYAGSRKGGVYAGKMKKNPAIVRCENYLKKVKPQKKKKGGWMIPAAMAASSLIPMAYDLVKGIFKKGSGVHGCGTKGKRMMLGSKGCGSKKKGGMTRRLLGAKKAGAIVTPGPLA